MVMPEKPVLEFAAFLNLIEEVCQCISPVQSSAESILDTAGAAMGNDVIYIPPCLIQCFPRSFVFIHAGQFLFPPRPVVDAEQRACGVELPQLSLIVRIIRFQNAVPDIVAAGAAHGEDALSADLIELPPHQMQDTGTDRLHLSAASFAHRVVPQKVIVFVITVNKQGSKGPVRQPVQPLCLIICPNSVSAGGAANAAPAQVKSLAARSCKASRRSWRTLRGLLFCPGGYPYCWYAIFKEQ